VEGDDAPERDGEREDDDGEEEEVRREVQA